MNNDTLRDGRNPGFYIIDKEIITIFGKILGPYGIAVYNVLVQYADRKGENAFPSYQTIADQLGISRTKAFNCIKQLIDLGLVAKASRHSPNGDMASNEYTLTNVKRLLTAMSLSGELGSTHGDIPSTPRDTPSTPRDIPSTPDDTPPSTWDEPPISRGVHDQEPMIKNQSLIKTQDQEPTNQLVARASARSVGLSKAQTARGETADQDETPKRLVGSSGKNQPTRDKNFSEEYANGSTPPDTSSVSDASPPHSGVPPAPNADEEARSYALLTDEEIGMNRAMARKFAHENSFAWLMAQVGTWWAQRQAGKANGVGALTNRLTQGWHPDDWPEEFLCSELYQRHYPLDQEEAEAWRRWQGVRPYADIVIGAEDLSKRYPPALVALLDALPAPVYGYVAYAEVEESYE